MGGEDGKGVRSVGPPAAASSTVMAASPPPPVLQLLASLTKAVERAYRGSMAGEGREVRGNTRGEVGDCGSHQIRDGLLHPLPPSSAASPPPGFTHTPATELKTLPDWSAHVKRIRSSLTVSVSYDLPYVRMRH